MSVSSWDYRDHAWMSSGCFDACFFFFGNSCELRKLVNLSSLRTLEGLVRRFVRAQMDSFEQVLFGCFLKFSDLLMPFVCLAPDVEYILCMRDMMHIDISSETSESNIVDLSQCCLPRPYSLLYLIRKVATWVPDLDMEV